MAKNYDLSKKSDMRKFERDLEKQALSSLKDESFDYPCPHCDKSIKIKSGDNICPYCKNEINVEIKL